MQHKIDNIRELQIQANDIRENIISMLLTAGSGHTAGPLGMADVFTALYFNLLRHDPTNPSWEDRDRVVLSNGHICPVLYATLAQVGYFPVAELQTLRKFGSRLQGHPHREFLDIVENSSGPLGSGLSQAVGMAIASRIDTGKAGSRFFYCLLGDGELDEGQNWEAVLLANKERLGNLIAIVDRNNIQIDGYTEDVMPMLDVAKKFESFGWHTQEIDGNNMSEIIDAVHRAQGVFSQPSVIVARTIPGKGVREFERKFEWHGKAPNKDEAKIALDELRTLGGKIKSEHK